MAYPLIYVSLCVLSTRALLIITYICIFPVPPDIITDESSPDLTLMEAENATLSRHATGNPEPKITWRRENNQPLMLRTGSRDLVKREYWINNNVLQTRT